jgi:hypothetical protein
MSAKRPVHLGIDYGTSTSKLVLRDYAAAGGERALLVGTRGNYRYPSAVSCGGGNIFLGVKPSGGLVGGQAAVCYESVKMRVADEVKGSPGRYYYGPPRDFPAGFRARDFAALSVWALITEGERAAREALGTSEVRLGMTMGIPMSFFADPELREEFLTIARAAWYLHRNCGVIPGVAIPFGDARRWLDDAFDAVASKGSLLPEQVRDWLRSEAEASMLWAFRSPGVPAGPYLKVDVGAGTTNASMFRILDEYDGGQLVKTGFAFFGTYSGPHGMDAVDHALATHLKMNVENCLDLRAQEDRLLHDGTALGAAQEAFSQIRNSPVEAWRAGYPRIMTSPLEVKNWEKAEVFVIGGGSLVAPLRGYLCNHPMGHGITMSHRQSDVPTDLSADRGAAVPADLLPFVMVAYGLSNLGLAVPAAETPDSIPPLRPMSAHERLSHMDIYGE